ncbi:helix-turn-helix transcriptional regulator [Mesorhizobium sp. B2-1-3A]|uniref:helix-turn-helix domain-containing protein n=1 Tax=Mesorhizobium sp. B2-1-3A TaxID=2589971 RepID=UPI001127F739|nr:helix-turn-helix transcriptional regulator [Mesorhizobium sp. B2-1-3A]TPM90602.1 helix-turn-helix transcriptional regulator [Mesorhizobium sp. B2-1-3A]
MRLRSVFARNLRLLRQATCLSQEQLADLAGLDRNYVGKLEREENSPTVDTMEVLALALQVDVEVLIRRSIPRHTGASPDGQ